MRYSKTLILFTVILMLSTLIQSSTIFAFVENDQQSEPKQNNYESSIEHSMEIHEKENEDSVEDQQLNSNEDTEDNKDLEDNEAEAENEESTDDQVNKESEIEKNEELSKDNKELEENSPDNSLDNNEDSIDENEEDKKFNDSDKQSLTDQFPMKVQETKTSKLGHINSSSVKIYPDLNDLSNTITAGSTYTHHVYYIKSEAKVNGETYYLLWSKEKGATFGRPGWVKSTDIKVRDHTVVDKKDKIFYVKGTSSAYNHAWGGKENYAYSDLSNYEDVEFKVHLTEKVGNEIWYRGTLEGKTVWIHSSHVSNYKETKTSKLGHINSSSVKIYPDLNDLSNTITAGSTYTHHVYYIKSEAKVNGETYYLLWSKEKGATFGRPGWVKSTDIKVRDHTVVDKKDKTFYVKGTSNAYNHAWGGKENYAYSSLSIYQGVEFKVHLTEKVGNEIWYRGTLDGKTVWIHSSHVSSYKETKTSKLGHINSSSVKIYPDLNDLSNTITAGSTYTHHVYYIKSEAKVNGETYYLLWSKEKGATFGRPGWVKSTDIKVRDHTVVDKKDKIFYMKGTSSAYNHAWGGKENYAYSDLSNYEDVEFKVHLTEKVGNEIWYRGTLDGKTVWIHSSHVSNYKETKTSKLGHINSSSVKIYPDLNDLSNTITAGSTYTHHVYYIKSEAKMNGETYYLLWSKEKGATFGRPGWVKSTDIKVRDHTVVDKKDRIFYVKGTSSAYNHAWGGKKNYAFPDLKAQKGKIFQVHLTEKVGSTVWYRGILEGKTVWIHSSHVSDKPLKIVTKTNKAYNLTLERMADLQMAVNPQTDKSYKLWIREDGFKKGSIKDGKGIIQGTNWNLRRGPGTNFMVGGKVNTGDVLTIYSSTKGSDGNTWYHVRNTSGWVKPDRSDLIYYLNPENFIDNFQDSLQFLNLRKSANVDITEVNQKILRNKGILDNKAATFVKASKEHNVNEIYLISHALLETGNGTSKLATGVSYNGKIVYNMYGIGAKDSCPLECGAKYAYEQGWFTPEEAIIGGARFVSSNYLNVGQDTLYKMRWNPAAAESGGVATHQYATDIGWAKKQTVQMNQLYNMLDSYSIHLEIPTYKK